MARHDNRARDGSGLKQELRQWQIFFIVLTNVIGGGVFSGNGEALEMAGPAGYLTALVVFGLISIAVLDGISEFTQLFPARNALPEYTRAFVDRDLGWVVGIAYWYIYSACFAAQNLAAANLLNYWGATQFWQTIAFYVLAPLILFGINLLGVASFGWIESVSGVFKICLALGTAITLYVIAGLAGIGNTGPINDGFQDNKNFAATRATAMCYAIPLVAFSYLGQEIFVVTSYEAKYSKDLKLPSRILPYVIFVLYLMIGIGEAINIKWTDKNLPRIFGGRETVDAGPVHDPRSTSMVIIAVFRAGHTKLAGFINGCLIFSVLSAGNVALYASSRTLYGMATQIPDTNVVGRHLQWLKIVSFRTGVPAWSLVVSALFFIWLPFIQLKQGYAAAELQEILSVSASISCIIVWLVLSIAFIRYHRWLSLCKQDLPTELPDYDRNTQTHKAWTAFGFAQPAMAWLGVIGCTCVLVFASAPWWDTPPSFAKVATAYTSLVVLLPLWIIIKLACYFRGYGWGFVHISPDVGELAGTLARLRYYKRDETEYEGETAVETPVILEDTKGFRVSDFSRRDDSSDQPPSLDDRQAQHAPEVSLVQTPHQPYLPLPSDQISQGTYPSTLLSSVLQSDQHAYQPLSFTPQAPPPPHIPPASEKGPI